MLFLSHWCLFPLNYGVYSHSTKSVSAELHNLNNRVCQCLPSLSHNTRELQLKQQQLEFTRCVHYIVAAISPLSLSFSLCLFCTRP